jgi:hypothetical protein
MRCLIILGTQGERKAETEQISETLVSESALTQLIVKEYLSSQVNAARGYYLVERVSITGTDFIFHYHVLIGPATRHGSYPKYPKFPSLRVS